MNFPFFDFDTGVYLTSNQRLKMCEKIQDAGNYLIIQEAGNYLMDNEKFLVWVLWHWVSCHIGYYGIGYYDFAYCILTPILTSYFNTLIFKFSRFKMNFRIVFPPTNDISCH